MQDVSISAKKALHGWLYAAPYQQNTPEARDFKTRVVLATQKMLNTNTTLPNHTDFDMTSAARLYDSIMLWAKLYSTVHRLPGRTAPSLAHFGRYSPAIFALSTAALGCERRLPPEV